MSFTDEFDAKIESTQFKPPFQDSLEHLGKTIAALQAKYRILEALNKESIEAARAAMRFPNK